MLLLIARALSARLIKRAKPKDTNIGFYLMGVALESSGGASLNQAQNRAADIYKKVFGADPARDELKAMAQVALLVEQTGARVGDLLRRQAEQLQRESLTQSEIQIEKLSVRLMLPLGLAVLPAFLFLTVIPLMFAMLGPK
jgi:tight adherence protein B